MENFQHHHHGGNEGEDLRENVGFNTYNSTTGVPTSAGTTVHHAHAHAQPMYIDSEDIFTIGPVGLTNLCDAMCIPPPDPDHATETDGEEGCNTTGWEPHLWSY